MNLFHFYRQYIEQAYLHFISWSFMEFEFLFKITVHMFCFIMYNFFFLIVITFYKKVNISVLVFTLLRYCNTQTNESVWIPSVSEQYISELSCCIRQEKRSFETPPTGLQCSERSLEEQLANSSITEITEKDHHLAWREESLWGWGGESENS